MGCFFARTSRSPGPPAAPSSSSSSSSHPHYSSVREIPVPLSDPTHRTHCEIRRSPVRTSCPEVVRIPLRFFRSQSMLSSTSALKIQKIFRGFLVRNNVKRIKDIKIHVDEIEEKLLKKEGMELVRKDDRERLRMNENLMALLLKLDSILCADSGVRNCRKAVIRKAIKLQDRVDAIALVHSVDQNGMEDSAENNSYEFEDSTANDSQNLEESIQISDELENRTNYVEECIHQKYDSVEENVESHRESLIENNEQKTGDWVEVEYMGKDKVRSEVKTMDDNKRNRDVMDRLMEENEKMMSLMKQLFEKNEMQNSMINALTHSVERLEKAFLCDQLRWKTKKTKISGSIEE